MANSDEEKQSQASPNSDEKEHQAPSNAEEEDENDAVEEEEEEEDEEDEPPQKHQSRESLLREHKSKMENLFHRMQTERVNLRVHDVIVKGNAKTKESLIEAELDALRNATTMQELLEAAGIANAKLQQLEIFDSVKITLDSGPPELPDTSNVIVEVVETSSPLSGECGAYMKTTARSWTVEGTLKYKNWFGYGDLWDGSLAYGPNQTSEVSAGVFLPRFRGLSTPVLARVSLLSQDWQEFSSYKERSMGLSLGLFSTRHHDLAYNLGWRTLTGSITNVIQEFDLRYAVPFGFYHAALNFGISAGVLFPWGQGFLNKPSPLPERFYLGGDFSPVCTMGGPTTVWGFKTRGLGPTEPRRQTRDKSDGDNSDLPGRDFLGGDLAVTAFADLSFDLPIKWLREHGVHGHIFAGAGNLAKLTENEFQNFSFKKFLESFRSSIGVGIVVPTKIFRLEGNFYYILKQHEHDRGKTGFRFSFSAPS
uniref:Bacterial surface antigen (D15) domain-containing protein n=1 Tax=Fagus sylvatica TaxID=28930 RepID=A0A2N9IWF7_FAGSY